MGRPSGTLAVVMYRRRKTDVLSVEDWFSGTPIYLRQICGSCASVFGLKKTAVWRNFAEVYGN